METKVVKFEIGKILAIIIVVIAIAVLASFVVKSTFFGGNIKTAPIEPLIEKIEFDPTKHELDKTFIIDESINVPINSGDELLDQDADFKPEFESPK
ncbi:hypothetical protein ACFL3T_02060 [Patescibacteria group bacterium]